MIWIGIVFSVGFLGYVGYDSGMQTSNFISAGAMSSNHATIAKDCASCHVATEAVSDALCSNCHEKNAARDIYDFKAHYLYRSNNFLRLSPDSLAQNTDHELECFECHNEHEGRDEAITQVEDSKCLTCHDYGSFNQRHPEFEFARKSLPDDSTLAMSHIRHIVFVLQNSNGINNVGELFKALKMHTLDFNYFYEGACFYCHNPNSDGKTFKNISFDEHCSECHVKSGAIVSGLPKSNPALASIGVETIQQMQQRGGPGLVWTYALNPRIILDESGEVTKNSITHQDPWILENLKQIRKKLYPVSGLFDLLNSFGDITESDVDSVYLDAINTLKQYADELQSHGELRNEIHQLNILLKDAAGRLAVPSSARTASNFQLPVSRENQRLSTEQKAAFRQLVNDLTSPDGPECQKCHIVENAAFRRIANTQRVMRRAEFSHGAHILEKHCVDCHTEIQFSEESLQQSVEKYSEFKLTKSFKIDKAMTQNLPKINSCQECHKPKQVAANCIKCHTFHPDKRRFSGPPVARKK